MNLFQTYQLRQTIKNNTNFVHSFLSIVEMNPPLYYVMNHIPLNILVYNENWEYQRTNPTRNTFYPTFSINVNGTIYIALINLLLVISLMEKFIFIKIIQWFKAFLHNATEMYNRLLFGRLGLRLGLIF